METRLIPMERIAVDPDQPRKYIDPAAIERLSQSLATEGLIHPIEVDTSYRIIVGERRFRAAKALGWTEIRATVYEGTLSAYHRLRRQIAENVQQSGAQGDGESMHPIDTARAWARLYELRAGHPYDPRSHKGAYGIIQDIAMEVGVSRSVITQHINLLKQPTALLDALRKKDVAYGAVRTIQTLPGSVKERIAEKIMTKELTKSADAQLVHQAVTIDPSTIPLMLNRTFDRESKAVNRFLSALVRMGVAAKEIQKHRIHPTERRMIADHVRWGMDILQAFMEE